MKNLKTKIDERFAAVSAAESVYKNAEAAMVKAETAYEDAKASLNDENHSKRPSKIEARKREVSRLFMVAHNSRQAKIRASWDVEESQSNLWWATAQAEYQLPDGAVKWCRGWHRNGRFAITCLGEEYSPEMGEWVGSKSHFDLSTTEYVYTCSFTEGEVVFTSRGVRRANPTACRLFGC